MYRKLFPSPSYGPGKDSGKEARWFGKTTADLRLKELAEIRRQATKNLRSISPPRRKQPNRLLFILMLTIAIIFILVIFGLFVWWQWGNQIIDFFTDFSAINVVLSTKLIP